MRRYVTYQRSASGTIERIHDARPTMTKAQRTEQYPHAERLLGWPETTVYWVCAAGPCVGVAK